MIDIETEKILTLEHAARTIPGEPHVSSLGRWMRTGIRGVRLETVAIGGRRYTTREAILRFIAATTEARKPTPHPVPPSTDCPPGPTPEAVQTQAAR